MDLETVIAYLRAELRQVNRSIDKLLAEDYDGDWPRGSDCIYEMGGPADQPPPAAASRPASRADIAESLAALGKLGSRAPHPKRLSVQPARNSPPVTPRRARSVEPD